MKLKKDKLLNQKILYLVLGIVILIGVGTGLFYQFFIGKEMKVEIINQMNHFFQTIKDGTLNFSNTFTNSISSNGLSLLFVWILGIFIIGIPFILILFLKTNIFLLCL